MLLEHPNVTFSFRYMVIHVCSNKTDALFILQGLEQFRKFLAVLALSVAHHRRQDLQLRTRRELHHAIGHLLDSYALLRSGAALGRGCGPLIVARPGMPLDNLADARDRVELIEGDLCDPATLRPALEGVEVVYHQGARDSMYLGKIDKGVVLAVVFDKSTTLGLVRLRVKRAMEELDTIIESLYDKLEYRNEEYDPFDEEFSEGVEQEIDNLFVE